MTPEITWEELNALKAERDRYKAEVEWVTAENAALRSYDAQTVTIERLKREVKEWRDLFDIALRETKL